MGLFDRFSKEAREKSALEGNIKKVLQKHGQSADRFAAMEKLKEMGTDEALYGLAKRFSWNYDKTIEDEQEKSWVEATLVALGPKSIPAVRRFALEAETVSMALRVLEQTASRERMLEILDELLAREEPGYTRNPSKKIQILKWLAEWKSAGSADASRRVVPYLKDFDAEVRFVAVDTLDHQRDEETAKDPLVDALVRPEEEHRRIKVRIGQLLADTGWSLGARKEEVGKTLAAGLPEFTLAGDVLKGSK